MTCHRRMSRCPFCRSDFIMENDRLLFQVKETLERIRSRFMYPFQPNTFERDYQFIVETYFEWTYQNKFRLRKYAPLQRSMRYVIEFTLV